MLSTFAYFTWKSTNNDISFTVNGAIVELNDGKDITGANLMPTLKYTSTGNINKPIKIRLKEETTDTVTVTMNLKINTIDAGLKDASFKYTLVNGSTIVKEGNFASASAGDTITLATLTNTSDTNKLTTTTSTYNLYIWIDGTMDNPNTMQSKSFDFSLDITGTNSSLEKETSTNTAVTMIEALDDGTTGDSGSGVYKISHDAIASSNSATGAEIPAVTDYRYYGANPNNYVCLDMEGQSTCPDRGLYRIIGSIYEEKAQENKLKVIKATPLTNGSTNEIAWNSSGSSLWATVTSGNYSNNLTSGASLMKLLNSGDWWNRTNTYANYGLTDTSKRFVSTSRYYLSGNSTSDGVTTKQWYAFERGTAKYGSNPTYWDGYVGLMYPSDYGYAAGNDCVANTTLYDYENGCNEKAWMYNSEKWHWLMTPVSNNDDVFDISSSGFVDYGNDGASGEGYVLPVFYLTTDTTITSGTGTSQEPYILS